MLLGDSDHSLKCDSAHPLREWTRRGCDTETSKGQITSSGIEVEGMPSVADREAARKRLADAIAKAKPQAGTPDAAAEN
mgnify:CR=1 FL=1